MLPMLAIPPLMKVLAATSVGAGIISMIADAFSDPNKADPNAIKASRDALAGELMASQGLSHDEAIAMATEAIQSTVDAAAKSSDPAKTISQLAAGVSAATGLGAGAMAIKGGVKAGIGALKGAMKGKEPARPDFLGKPQRPSGPGKTPFDVDPDAPIGDGKFTRAGMTTPKLGYDAPPPGRPMPQPPNDVPRLTADRDFIMMGESEQPIIAGYGPWERPRIAPPADAIGQRFRLLQGVGD